MPIAKVLSLKLKDVCNPGIGPLADVRYLTITCTVLLSNLISMC